MTAPRRGASRQRYRRDLFEILAPLRGATLFYFIPVVFAALQPPATICQPSGLMPRPVLMRNYISTPRTACLTLRAAPNSLACLDFLKVFVQRALRKNGLHGQGTNNRCDYSQARSCRSCRPWLRWITTSCRVCRQRFSGDWV